jgi:protein-tyrosine phosphatase
VQRDRVLGLEGSPNFRDAGGYASGRGGRLHWGCLYRSGHLAHLTPADEAVLAGLELELVVDLRRADEREHEPSKLPPTVSFIGAEITPGSQASALYADATRLGGAEGMFAFMCEINREFVLSQSDLFRDIFTALLDSGARRVLFHCSAGKDRTGFAIAMLHLALDVAHGDIETDYLLSQRYFLPEEQLVHLRARYGVGHLADADILPLVQTERAYLAAALEAIDATWPSREAYLEGALGLGPGAREELRRRFVDMH